MLTKIYRKTILDEDWVSIFDTGFLAKPSSPLVPSNPSSHHSFAAFEESV